MPQIGTTAMPLPQVIKQKAQNTWSILLQAVNTFERIDGTQWAGAFAHFAFFALFPLIVLFVTVASTFFDRELASAQIIDYVESYVPIDGEEQRYIFDTVGGVIKERGQASLVALAILAWAAMGFFSTLIRATNRAWGLDAHGWLRLPLKSLFFLAIMVAAMLLSIAVPMVVRMVQEWLFPSRQFESWVHDLVGGVLPLLVVFLSLGFFYWMAPRRRPRFSEVWIAALSATLLLQAAKSLFVIYLKQVASLNAVYGTFGSIIALLLWIYLSGCIFVFGACICAAQAETRAAAEKPLLPTPT